MISASRIEEDFAGAKSSSVPHVWEGGATRFWNAWVKARKRLDMAGQLNFNILSKLNSPPTDRGGY